MQIGEKHYYFGSKKAIYDVFDKEQLGIGYSSLLNVKKLEEIPYKNKKCIIREGVLIQTSGVKGKLNQKKLISETVPED